MGDGGTRGRQIRFRLGVREPDRHRHRQTEFPHVQAETIVCLLVAIQRRPFDVEEPSEMIIDESG